MYDEPSIFFQDQHFFHTAQSSISTSCTTSRTKHTLYEKNLRKINFDCFFWFFAKHNFNSQYLNFLFHFLLVHSFLKILTPQTLKSVPGFIFYWRVKIANFVKKILQKNFARTLI